MAILPIRALPVDDELNPLEREFLQKVSWMPKGLSSIEEMNDGLRPKWNIDAAESLIFSGHLVIEGRDPARNRRYAVTAKGREYLKAIASPERRPAAPNRGAYASAHQRRA